MIPSKGRADSIGRHTLALFPDATVYVDEAERDTYAEVVNGANLETHPGLVGLTAIRNSLIDRQDKDEVLVCVDDDIYQLRSVVGWLTRRFREPEVATQVLEQAAQCALDLGCGLFGFNQSPNPLYFKPTRPWRLDRWIGSLVGYCPGAGLRYDERFRLHGDIDLCLQSLLKHRVIWCDDRWSFYPGRLKNKGGSSHLRTAELELAELQLLKEKWGQYVAFSTVKRWGKGKGRRGGATSMLTSVRVTRRQGA